MTVRGTGLPFGSIVGCYYNPLVESPWVVIASAISPDSLNDTTPTVTLPVTPNAGDRIIAHVAVSGPNSDPTITPPSGEGFVSVADGYDTTQRDTKAQAFEKIWGAGDTDNLTITFTSTLANARLVLLIVRNSDPLAGAYGSALVGATNSGSANLVAPSVFAPQNALLLGFFGCRTEVTADASGIYGGLSYSATAGTDLSCAGSAQAALPGSTATLHATAIGLSVNGWEGVAMALEGAGLTPSVMTVGALSPDVSSSDATAATNGTPASGEILLAHVTNQGSQASFTMPAGEGWQTASGLRIASATAFNSVVQIFWKRWGDGHTDNESVTVVGTGGNTRMVLLRIADCVASGTPFPADGVAAACDDASNDTSCNSPSVVVLEAGSLVVRLFACSAVTGIELNAPMIEKYDGVSYSYINGENGAMAGSIRTSGAVATGQRSAAASTTTMNGWVGITLVVPPPA